jgi:hypothetical protein
MTNSGLNLGQLITELNKFPKEYFVEFDFARLVPLEFGSYRGYYEHLYIGFSDEKSPMSVGLFLSSAKEAVGKTFTGYKGGNYKMTTKTTLWVANYSHSSSTVIEGLSAYPEESLVVIRTTREQ